MGSPITILKLLCKHEAEQEFTFFFYSWWVSDPGILRALNPRLRQDCVHLWAPFSVSFILKQLHSQALSTLSYSSTDPTPQLALPRSPCLLPWLPPCHMAKHTQCSPFRYKAPFPQVLCWCFLDPKACKVGLQVLTCLSLSLDCWLLGGRDGVHVSLPSGGLAQVSSHSEVSEV